jgi:hypothetical protein
LSIGIAASGFVAFPVGANSGVRAARVSLSEALLGESTTADSEQPAVAPSAGTLLDDCAFAFDATLIGRGFAGRSTMFGTTSVRDFDGVDLLVIFAGVFVAFFVSVATCLDFAEGCSLMSGTAICNRISGTAESARADSHHAALVSAATNSAAPRFLHHLEARRRFTIRAFSAMEASLTEK